MSAIAAFQLTSTKSGTLPFAIGHAFVEGDIPAGKYAHLDLENFEVVPLKYWHDGSLRHAKIIGRAALVAGIPRQINIVKRDTQNVAGKPLTAEDIRIAAPSASAVFSDIGSVTLESLLASPTATWVSTKEMVECHYQAMVDVSLYVKFVVKLFASGHKNVEIIAGNGLFSKDGCVEKKYIPTLKIGGDVVFDNKGQLKTHSLWSRYRVSGWVGENPSVRPTHDTGYLIRTKYVPNFWKMGVPTAAVAYLEPIKEYSPGNTLGFSPYMPEAGYQDQIGLLPKWDSLYITTQAHPAAYDAVLAHGDAINEYAIAYADPTTLGPIKLDDFPYWSVQGNYGGAHPGEATVAGQWEKAHHPSSGFLAYLLTGDYYYLETVQFTAKLIYLLAQYGFGTGIGRVIDGGQNRAMAWCHRSIAQASSVVPDAATDMLDVIHWMGNLASYRRDRYTLDKTREGYFLGYEDLYSNRITADPSIAPNGEVCVDTAGWEHHFNSASWNYALDLEAASLEKMPALKEFADYTANAPVWICGGTQPDEFNFGFLYLYTINFRIKKSMPYYAVPATEFCPANGGQIFTDSVSTSPTDIRVNPGTNVLNGSPSICTSYWANFLPAIAYAVDHSKEGAQESFNRILGADNFSSTMAKAPYDEIPQWGIVPRSYSMQPLLFAANDNGVVNSTPTVVKVIKVGNPVGVVSVGSDGSTTTIPAPVVPQQPTSEPLPVPAPSVDDVITSIVGSLTIQWANGTTKIVNVKLA